MAQGSRVPEGERGFVSSQGPLTKCKTGHLQTESQECLLFTKHLVRPILEPKALLISMSYFRLSVTQAQRKGDVQSHDQSPAGTGGRGWDSRLQHACTLARLGRYITRARKGSRKPLESGKLVGVSGRENEQGAWFLNNGLGLGNKCIFPRGGRRGYEVTKKLRSFWQQT